MTPVQKWTLKLSEARGKLADALDADEQDHEAIQALTREVRHADEALTAATLLAPETPEPVITETRQYDSKLAELRASVDLEKHVKAALAGTIAQGGPEGEYNTELKIEAGWFPLDLLTRNLEERAARDGDGAASQATWLDYLFAGSAADRVGVSFRPVASGTHTVPTFSAAPSGVQRARGEAVAEGTYTLAVSEMKPKRSAVYGIYSVEDESRLGGMSDAMVRAMSGGIASAVDLAIFKGDSGASGTDADIAGFQTALAAAQEVTITQANKILAAGTLAGFMGMVDGRYAAAMGDLQAVLSVGANTLWGSTVPNSANGNQRTIAAILMENGLAWTTRDGIDTNTANGDFGAYIGLAQGIDGAAVASVWNQGRLVRDEFSGKAKGEIELTLDYQWDFAVVRGENFRRLKFVA